MFSVIGFVLGVLSIVVWYVLQDLTHAEDENSPPKRSSPDTHSAYSHMNERPERTCTCGAISQLVRAFIEMHRTMLKQIFISHLKKELCRSLNYFCNGWAEIQLIHFSMGPYMPKILSIRRVPDVEFTVAMEVEYFGTTSILLRVRLPLVEKFLGADTGVKCECTLEKLHAVVLLTLSSYPYPHLRVSLESIPRWFLRKKIIVSCDREVQSRLFSWVVDFTIASVIRTKLVHPVFIMSDKLYPFEWDMLQKQEAVYQEHTFLDLTFDTLFRITQKNKMFLIATIEPTPWIHMDLVNLTPIAYFTLELKRKNSFYPGLVLVEHRDVDISREICHPSVTVRSIFPDSAAEDALFLEGDVILAVNDLAVGSAQRAVELMDAAQHKARVRVQRIVHFKWSRTNQTMVPSVEWLDKSDVTDIFPYPQSRCTKNRNLDAVLGTPEEIMANALSNGFQHLRTKEFDLAKGIDGRIRIPLSRKNMYISFGIWTASECDFIGYGSMLLDSCVGWCQETSGEMSLRLPLGHPDDMKKSRLPSHLDPYREVPGFNVRLTHGEIAMRLQIVHEG